MYNYYAVYNTYGQVVKFTYRAEIHTLIAGSDLSAEIITPELFQLHSHRPTYRVDGEYFFVPDAPTEDHIFDYEILEWIDERDIELIQLSVSQWIRRLRQPLLRDSDWTQIVDVDLSEAEILAWQVYRQALRDLPETYATETDRAAVIWPTPPS